MRPRPGREENRDFFFHARPILPPAPCALFSSGDVKPATIVCQFPNFVFYCLLPLSWKRHFDSIQYQSSSTLPVISVASSLISARQVPLAKLHYVLFPIDLILLRLSRSFAGGMQLGDSIKCHSRHVFSVYSVVGAWRQADRKRRKTKKKKVAGRRNKRKWLNTGDRTRMDQCPGVSWLCHPEYDEDIEAPKRGIDHTGNKGERRRQWG